MIHRASFSAGTARPTRAAQPHRAVSTPTAVDTADPELRRTHRRLPWLDGLMTSRAVPGGFGTASGASSSMRTDSVEGAQTSRDPPDVDHHSSTTRTKIPPDSPMLYNHGRAMNRRTQSSLSQRPHCPSADLGDPQTLIKHISAGEHANQASGKSLAFVQPPDTIEIPKRTSSLDPTSLRIAPNINKALPRRPYLDDVPYEQARRGSRKLSSARSFTVPAHDMHLCSRSASPTISEDTVHTCSLQGVLSSFQDSMEAAAQVLQTASQHGQGDELENVLREANVASERAGAISLTILEALPTSDSELDTSDESSEGCFAVDGSATVHESLRSIATHPTSLEYSSPVAEETCLFCKAERMAAIRDETFEDTRPGDFPREYLKVNADISDEFNHQRPGDFTCNHVTLRPFPADSLHPTDNLRVNARQATMGWLASMSPQELSKLHSPPSATSIIRDFAYPRLEPVLSQAEGSKGSSLISPSQHSSMLKPCSPSYRDQRPPIAGSVRDSNTNILPLIMQAPVILGPVTPKAPDRPPPPIPAQVDARSQTSVSKTRGVSKPQRHQPQRRLGDPRSMFESNYYRMAEETIDRPHAFADRAEPGEMPVEQLTLKHPRRHHVSLGDRQNSIRVHKYKRKGVAREWQTIRKRLAAVVACLNTSLVGLMAGIYAGEVPKIQYQLADTQHRVILGNVLLYLCLGLTTLLAWPLPLLHGRKPYVLVALILTLPLQFPQALAVGQSRNPSKRYYMMLLIPRALSGLCLGFANVNFISTLLDLFGASLQSHRPHQEIVDFDNIRRQGGGMGLWLGVWAFCFVGSLALGFLIGAAVTAHLEPAWGFYFIIIALAIFLFLNVIAPETRRAPHRRSVLHYFDEEQQMRRRVARGEVKLHLSRDGPRYWWEEVIAGVKLMLQMIKQPGFCILATYTAWIYAMIVLVTLLLGALLSTNYRWKPQQVGGAVFALAIGAMFAIPLSKANLFSRDRSKPPRTDSMTLKPQVTWSSHMIRRCIFTFLLPVAGLAFTMTEQGPAISWVAPTMMSALVGFLSTLAIAECVGLIMETFDTCDLQPGVNSKHRLQSLEESARRRRTNYSAFPRVAAGIFISQGLGFLLAAAATGVSGRITRALGAQRATGVTAGVLLLLTVLLSLVLWRFQTVQVIPNHAFGTKKGSNEWTAEDDDKYWKPVIVGNPSGKVRRMNLLESGQWSRWTEIRKLNKLTPIGKA